MYHISKWPSGYGLNDCALFCDDLYSRKHLTTFIYIHTTFGFLGLLWGSATIGLKLVLVPRRLVSPSDRPLSFPRWELLRGGLFFPRSTEKVFAAKLCVLVTTPIYFGTYDLRTYWKGLKVKVGNHTKIANSENKQKSKTTSLIFPWLGGWKGKMSETRSFLQYNIK